MFHYLFRMAPHVCIAPSTRANACETLNFLSVFPQVHHSAWKNRSTELQNSLRRPLLAQFDSFYTTEVSLRKVVVKPGFSVQKHGLLGLSTGVQIQGRPRVSGRCCNKSLSDSIKLNGYNGRVPREPALPCPWLCSFCVQLSVRFKRLLFQTDFRKTWVSGATGGAVAATVACRDQSETDN